MNILDSMISEGSQELNDMKEPIQQCVGFFIELIKEKENDQIFLNSDSKKTVSNADRSSE